MQSSPITLRDRLIAAVLSTFAAFGTAVLAPGIALIAFTRGRGAQFLNIYASANRWGAAIVLYGFLLGFYLGAEKATNFYSHLWYTANPKNRISTAAAWFSMIAVGYLGYATLPANFPS